MKPSKSLGISLTREKVVEKRFCVDKEEIPSIMEKPVKSLGWCYNRKLDDTKQVQQLRNDVTDRLEM